MRFGLLHRVLVDAVAALGLFAMIVCGAWPGLGIALAVALALPERWRARAVTTAAAFAVAGAFVLGRALRADAITCVLDATGAALVVCVATRVGASRDRPTAAIAFLGAALGGVVGGGGAHVALLTALIVLTPGALVLSHLRREVEGNYRQGARDRSGQPVDVPRILRSRRVVGRETAVGVLGVGIVTALAGACAFVLMPRGGLDLFGVQKRPQRFSEIDLSRRDVPGDALVLRYRSATHPLRLRGAVLDAWDGTRWTRSAAAPRPYASGPREGVHVTLEADALEPGILLVPERTGAVAADSPLVVLPGAELRFGEAVERPLRWEAWISSGNVQVTGGNIDVTTPLAGSRVRALAHAWADAEHAPLAKARAIERRLREGFAYDLRSPSRGASDPLDHFLFVTKRGHCELFASALAVMLREVGVPSRVVTGYVGGDWNTFGHFYAVRDRDAHAWVEAWTGSAWTTLDATPTAPRAAETGAFVTARDLTEALARRGDEPTWLRALRESLLAVLGLLLGGWLLARVARMRRARIAAAPALERLTAAEHEAAALYAKLEAALVARGVPRDASEPPLRHAEQLAARRHPLAPEVVALTTVYLEARFGGAPLTRATRRDFERRVRRLAEAPHG